MITDSNLQWTAFDAMQHGQATTTRTLIAKCALVAQFVANEWCCIVSQAGDNEPAPLKWRALATVCAQHFHQHTLSLHMIVRILRTLQRDIAEFLAAITISNAGAKNLFNQLAQLLSDTFTQRTNLAPRRQGFARPAKAAGQ